MIWGPLSGCQYSWLWFQGWWLFPLQQVAVIATSSPQLLSSSRICLRAGVISCQDHSPKHWLGGWIFCSKEHAWGFGFIPITIVDCWCRTGRSDLVVPCPRGCKHSKSAFSCLNVSNLVPVLGPLIQGTSGVVMVTYLKNLCSSWNFFLWWSLGDLLGAGLHHLLLKKLIASCSCCFSWSRYLCMVMWWGLKCLVYGMGVLDLYTLSSIVLACCCSQFAINTTSRVPYGRMQDNSGHHSWEGN